MEDNSTINYDNYFQLETTEPVVNDFVQDHTLSVKLVIMANDYLKEFVVRKNKVANDPDESVEQLVIDFYTGLCRIHSELESAFTNLQISYFALKEAAQTNDTVRTEFNKLPPNFEALQDTLNSILSKYSFAIDSLKERM
ncbi:MAG: hypothetical protein IPN22_04125 [Bacteroidetes bacterium]|nr:hypothetical protein [Bacteroidota bacterium]